MLLICDQTCQIVTASRMPSLATIVVIAPWAIVVRESVGETSVAWKPCGPMTRILRWGVTCHSFLRFGLAILHSAFCDVLCITLSFGLH